MKKKTAAQTAHQVFGLTPNQIRTAQEGPGAQAAPGQDPAEPASTQVAAEVGQLFKATYDAKGPAGIIELAYSAQTPEVQAEMKGMLEADPDSTIDLMVEALSSNPEAVQAWLAFTSELAPQDDAPEAEAAPQAEHEAQEGDEGEPVSHCYYCDCELPEGEVVCDSDLCLTKYNEEYPNGHQATEEPEFKVGDAVEPVDNHGMTAGTPVMVSGIKHGSYLYGARQATLGTFAQVEKGYRRVGEKLTGRKVKALRQLVGSPTVDKVLAKRRAQSDLQVGDACYNPVLGSVRVVGFDDAHGTVLVRPAYRETNDQDQYVERDRLRKEGKRAQADMHDVDGIADYIANSLEHTQSEGEAEAELKSLYSLTDEQAKAIVKLGWEIHSKAILTDAEVMPMIVQALGGHTVQAKIAVDAATVGYFQSYFGQYGASLVRPLAFKKTAKKTAQVGDFEASYTLIDAVKHACQRMPADAKTVTGNAGGVIVTFSTEDEASKFANFVGRFLATEHGIGCNVKHMSGEGPVPTVLIEETHRTGKKAQHWDPAIVWTEMSANSFVKHYEPGLMGAVDKVEVGPDKFVADLFMDGVIVEGFETATAEEGKTLVDEAASKQARGRISKMAQQLAHGWEKEPDSGSMSCYSLNLDHKGQSYKARICETRFEAFLGELRDETGDIVMAVPAQPSWQQVEEAMMQKLDAMPMVSKQAQQAPIEFEGCKASLGDFKAWATKWFPDAIFEYPSDDEMTFSAKGVHGYMSMGYENGELESSDGVVRASFEEFLTQHGGRKTAQSDSLDELIKEHKRLVEVLKSPSHIDDVEEAKKQEKELREYIEQKKTAQAEPAPEFAVGDQVSRDDDSNSGVVESVGKYDDYAKTHRYHVRQQDGSLIWWNGSSTKKSAQSTAVSGPMDALIEAELQASPGMTPAEAAAKILASKEGWYKQTPEGEYLMSVSNKTAQADEGQVVTIYCEQPVSWAILEAIEKDWGQDVAQVDEKSFNLHYKPDQDLAVLHEKMMKVLADHLTPAGIEIREIAP